ncbi:cytochrome C biogenesis protein [Gammaproteobacteria bacterium 50_400_T64]|nr:cytochrome C biogenesis protein [Gammaproteobacteria bacterium 50_400_T64]
MEFKDYYDTLGLARDVTQDEIKRAYRKLARKYHPDVSKEDDAEQKFKALGEAYEVLKDPEKRAAYDQLGANWQGGQDFNAPPDWDTGFEFSGGGFTQGGGEAYSDFFESLFGQSFRDAGRQHPHSQQGGDRHARVVIDLEDSLNGATRKITFHVPEVDPQGHVKTRERVLNIKIPKGIAPGQSIRLAGQGDPGAGDGKAGNLYLDVEFKKHPLYRLDGADISIDVPVAPWEMALGASIKVPTPSGLVDVKIPAGSAHGKKLRFKDKGLSGKTPGHFYVVLKVVLPPADSPEAEKAYQTMAQDLAFNPRAELGV